MLQLLQPAQEQVVHVPKVIQQERIQHQQVEQLVEVHVPMTQEHGGFSVGRQIPQLYFFQDG